MLASGYVLAALSCLLRSLTALAASGSGPDPFGPGPVQTAALLLSVPSLTACTLGFVLLHREQMECEIRLLADLDHLTGLQNRRGFEAVFAREMRATAASGAWTSLALIDIDHFKAVNDRHGHAVGDKALVELARIISRELRGDDAVARIGGDEFCVLLPRTPPERAALAAERLRRAVAGHGWDALGLTVPLTVTIGLASERAAASTTARISCFWPTWPCWRPRTWPATWSCTPMNSSAGPPGPAADPRRPGPCRGAPWTCRGG